MQITRLLVGTTGDVRLFYYGLGYQLHKSLILRFLLSVFDNVLVEHGQWWTIQCFFYVQLDFFAE